MKNTPDYQSATTTKTYDQFLKAVAHGARSEVEEFTMPAVQILSITGNEPPASEQYQNALAALYGLAYTLKMGLKFKKIPHPTGYFDFAISGLETLWWSTAGHAFEIANPDTLHWQAFLIVPGFVTQELVDTARTQAQVKKPRIPYSSVRLETFDEGRVVQLLHTGPYDQVQVALDTLHSYMEKHRLTMRGKHHEIYLNDPSRTTPGKLKTVVRLPVTPTK